MNFWCYPKGFIGVLKEGFPAFLSKVVTMQDADPMKEEYLLPIIADGMLKEGVAFTVLPINEKWFGVTYKEDKPAVADNFRKLIADGLYKKELYADL